MKKIFLLFALCLAVFVLSLVIKTFCAEKTDNSEERKPKTGKKIIEMYTIEEDTRVEIGKEKAIELAKKYYLDYLEIFGDKRDVKIDDLSVEVDCVERMGNQLGRPSYFLGIHDEYEGGKMFIDAYNGGLCFIGITSGRISHDAGMAPFTEKSEKYKKYREYLEKKKEEKSKISITKEQAKEKAIELASKFYPDFNGKVFKWIDNNYSKSYYFEVIEIDPKSDARLGKIHISIEKNGELDNYGSRWEDIYISTIPKIDKKEADKIAKKEISKTKWEAWKIPYELQLMVLHSRIKDYRQGLYWSIYPYGMFIDAMDGTVYDHSIAELTPELEERYKKYESQQGSIFGTNWKKRLKYLIEDARKENPPDTKPLTESELKRKRIIYGGISKEEYDKKMKQLQEYYEKQRKHK